MKKQSLVSVIIPTYNREKYIRRAIESVLDQTYQNVEIVVVDDGSTDNTSGVIKSLKDSRIIYIYQENQGRSAARNTGIKIAKGEYIALLDSDDIWFDNKKLEKQISFLEDHPEYILVGGGVIVINNEEKELFRYSQPKNDYEIRKVLLFKCPLANSSVLFKKKEVRKIRLYKEDLRFATEDWEFWMRLGKVGKLYNFPDYFVKYRVHQENAPILPQLKEGIKIIKIHKNDYPGYFRALIYNYGKLFFFSLPFSRKLFIKFLSIKKYLTH